MNVWARDIASIGQAFELFWVVCDVEVSIYSNSVFAGQFSQFVNKLSKVGIDFVVEVEA